MIEEEYYKERKDKVIDFIIGFFGIWGLYTLLSVLSGLILLSLGTDAGIFIFSIPIFLLLIISIIAVIISFKKNRRYIGIGIMASYIIPLLLVGACFGIFSLLN